MDKKTLESIAGVVDHTYLKTEAEGASAAEQERQVKNLAQEAHQYGAYGVCVREKLVKLARTTLEVLQSKVKVVSVIGFPRGDDFSTDEKIRLISRAHEDGAHEFDMVIRFEDLRMGLFDRVYDDVLKVSAAAKDRVLKVIIENAYLSPAQRDLAYTIVMAAFEYSAEGKSELMAKRFLKTSTGFAKPAAGVAVGATLEDVKRMFEISRGRVGIKPAGGVKTAEDAVKFFESAGAPVKEGRWDAARFRIGTSSLLQAIFDKSMTGSGY